MAIAAKPDLEPGRVYRTRDLAAWGANATRLARRLMRTGHLVQLGHGLYAHPRTGRFGAVPPSDEEVVRAFLDGGPFVITGPERWNTLGLGATALFARPLVYNTKRTGEFSFGNRRLRFRRVAFPPEPTAEWFVVDLIEHAEQAGVARATLASGLAAAMSRGRFDRERLLDMARKFGTRRTLAFIECILAGPSE